MTVTWKLGAIVAFVLVAAGWILHGIANGPPPNVKDLLRAADSVAGAERLRLEDSVQRERNLADAAHQQTTDSLARAAAGQRARVLVLGRRVDSAQRVTDSVIAELADSVGRGVTLALGREREAQRVKDSAHAAVDSTAADQLRTAQNRVAILTGDRSTDSTRINELERTVLGLRDGLKRASRKGWDPAVTLSYGVGCQNVTVGGSVRVLGWLRGGVHIESKHCP